MANARTLPQFDPSDFINGRIVNKLRALARTMELRMAEQDRSVLTELHYDVASLPLDAKEGARAYATDGRKSFESAGNGTGVPVYYSAGDWRVFRDDNKVTN